MIFNDEIYRDATIEEKYWGRPRREAILEIREYLGNLRSNYNKSPETEFVTIPRLKAQIKAIQNQAPLERLPIEDRAYILLYGDLFFDSAEVFKACLLRLPDPVSSWQLGKATIRMNFIPKAIKSKFEFEPDEANEKLPHSPWLEFQLFMEIEPGHGQNSSVWVWWQIGEVPVTSRVKSPSEMAKDLKALVGRNEKEI